MRNALLLALPLSLAGVVPAQTFGSFVRSGTGCRDTPSALYEVWGLGTAPAQTFDLSRAGLEWTPNGLGCYRVAETPGGLLPASASRMDTMAEDDAISGPWTLGFTFTDAAGNPHSNVGVAPNGYVYLSFGSTTDERCCNGSTALASFLNDGASFALYGQDLNPGDDGAGTIWFDQDLIGGRQVAYWTWDRVEEFSAFGSANTCQLQLWDDGRCVMVWGSTTQQLHDVIVGWSAGGGQNPSGTTDLSAALAGGGPIDCGRVSLPLNLDSGAFPTTGRTATFALSDLPSNTVAASLLFGTSAIAVPLDAIGMESCFLYTGAELGSRPMQNLNPGAGSADLSVMIPQDPTLVGQTFFAQSVAIAPQFTSLGAISSNLGEVTIGDRPVRAIVETRGDNTFNSDPTSGFWSVDNLSTANITSIDFDWAASSNPGQNGIVFDSDQDNMGDRFDGGNSLMAGCLGTYRLGTEIDVGLVFAGTPAAGCDPAANTGWTTTGTPGADNRDVRFQFDSFAPGDRFEWDMDTDGGVGVSGDSMDGCVITVTFSDGVTVSGEIRAVRPDLGRAVL